MATAIAGRGPSAPLRGYSAVGSAVRAPFVAGAALGPPTPGDSGSSRTAASAASGRRTVREPTIESYCSNAHLRDARFAEDSRPSSTSAGSDASSTAGGAGYSGVAGSAGSRSYAGHSSTSAVTGRSPTSASPSKTRRRPLSVTSPIAVPSTSQRAQTASTS